MADKKDFPFKAVIAVLVVAGILFFFGKSSKTKHSLVSKEQAANFEILIDAGHGGFDNGALGNYNHEASLNLAVSLKLRDELLKMGYKVTMIRSDENALSSDKNSDMAKRKNIINQSSADILVSVHMNSNDDKSVSGPVCYFMPKSVEGEKLAKYIQQAMNDELNPPSPKKCQAQNYLVLRSGDMPSVLVECGFLTNKAEEKKLNDEKYQTKLAKSIAIGITDYLAVKI